MYKSNKSFSVKSLKKKVLHRGDFGVNGSCKPTLFCCIYLFVMGKQKSIVIFS